MALTAVMCRPVADWDEELYTTFAAEVVEVV